MPYSFMTPTMVDAMGVTGCEGVFRRAMEVSIAVLCTNKDALLSLLEPFLRDPTVAWGRDGRAQSEEVSGVMTRKGGGAFNDVENKDAMQALQRISERLGGVYNIRHPKAQRIRENYATRKEPGPFMGIGASKEDLLPLSVSGQVQRLIDEATSEANLAQMYIGWMPWV